MNPYSREDSSQSEYLTTVKNIRRKPKYRNRITSNDFYSFNNRYDDYHNSNISNRLLFFMDNG